MGRGEGGEGCGRYKVHFQIDDAKGGMQLLIEQRSFESTLVCLNQIYQDMQHNANENYFVFVKISWQ
jgi:hypothetical protein